MCIFNPPPYGIHIGGDELPSSASSNDPYPYFMTITDPVADLNERHSRKPVRQKQAERIIFFIYCTYNYKQTLRSLCCFALRLCVRTD